MVSGINGSRILTLATAPADKPVSLTDTKAHIRVDGTTEDALVNLYVGAATRVVEQKAGRTLVTQTWDESFKTATKQVGLSLNPVQSLVSVKYYDTSNVLQTATLSDFTLVKCPDAPYVESDNWPTTYDRADAITIQYIAGYGLAAAVPETLRHAVLLIVGQYYEYRMNAEEIKANPIPLGVEDLIGLERGGWYG